MNVSEYLKRMNYQGSLKPSIVNLMNLVEAHKTSIPYSTLIAHGTHPMLILNLEHIFDHVITRKMAGSCYELNCLFVWLLQQLGYDAFYGQGAYYLPEGIYTHDYYHMIPIVTISNTRYYVDVGWTIFGPMKIEHMTTYSDNFGLYRMRLYPKRGDDFYIVERHKKTVLNAKGKIIKTGPALNGRACKDGNECKKDGSHWVPNHIISTKKEKLENFQTALDLVYHPDLLLQKNIFMARYEMMPGKMLFHSFDNNTYKIKQAITSVVDKILFTKTAKTDIDIVEIAEKYFNYRVDHPVIFFRKAKL